MMKSQKFPYHGDYISLNWLTFQNNRKTYLSISVYHNIYMKNKQKWTEMKISGLTKREFTSITS